MNEKQLIQFVRAVLTENGEKLRFNMSGYEGHTGDCVIENQNILNKFAKFGIYDTTHFLYLDFYKGNGTLYYRLIGESNTQVIVYGGYSTSEIIADILTRFVLDESLPKRRRG